uniref:Uncharacterized protein n=1 Tax=Setaria italica TaxID=4555 RepID=K3ZWM8_SETIT
MARKSCPGTMPSDFTGNSMMDSSVLPVDLVPGGKTSMWYTAAAPSLALEQPSTFVLLHGEQDVGADHGVGRDADLRWVAVLKRIEAAREDGRRRRQGPPPGPTRVVSMIQIKDEEPWHEVQPGQRRRGCGRARTACCRAGSGWGAPWSRRGGALRAPSRFWGRRWGSYPGRGPRSGARAASPPRRRTCRAWRRAGGGGRRRRRPRGWSGWAPRLHAPPPGCLARWPGERE